MRIRRHRNPIVFSPIMWGLLAAFLLAALVTAFLTFLVFRELFASQLGSLEKIPALLLHFRPTPEASLDANTTLQKQGPTPQVWDGTNRVNILVMGLDLRDWEGGGPSRTDTMILFTIDPPSRTAGILSIPRDLWVNIPGFDYGKLNTAYYLGELYQLPGGGPGLAILTVENLLDIKINYYAQIDFTAFEKFIDMIGGIQLNVPEEITVDPIGPRNTVTLEPGLQTLDGATALAYARNRDTFGGDFDRAKRQQQVVLAIRDQVLNLDILPVLIKKSPALYKQLASGVNSNLTLDEAIKLAWLAQQISPKLIRRANIGPEQVTMTYSPDGLDILMPDINAVRLLRDEVFTTTGPVSPAVSVSSVSNPPLIGPMITETPVVTPIDPQEAMQQENARVSILNATNTIGLAAETTQWLKTQGINVIETSNAQELTASTSIIDYSGKPYTVQHLISLMNIEASRVYSRFDPNSQVDIAILLGEDWAQNHPIP